ncbi:hypothetical protein A3F52_02185 [Candidatus Uhrbacteria bacterium RIFCSPHIGHO2_12_FULL_47_11]|nr:MAG: hypothetical protein A2753_00775 [Candidatus Uhrbacteria bacterium RIFCSPHIGHO2_01_FULL_47_11]OGL68524.1 MAG: hypothetical protein A3D58_00625 [Candidatus Uhrbacteria bacterium RIFCSPHIGHO2_02_FULL_46_47]OGL76825.1 MAG: hypothetical protein A3F52_02185 [Candidatus Uhrbacteria bacterium RIFCSPHIGHO2_12_FULL_47_11]
MANDQLKKCGHKSSDGPDCCIYARARQQKAVHSLIPRDMWPRIVTVRWRMNVGQNGHNGHKETPAKKRRVA